jgi:integrase
MALTEDLLKQHPRPKSGQLFAWDDLVAGFGVRFTPSATAFIVQWRDSSGAKRRETLKRWPGCTVKDARNLARLKLSQAVASRATGADVPLRLAMRSWFERKTQVAKWRPRYRSKVDAIVSTYIEGVENPRVRLTPTAQRAIDLLGRKPVSSVTRSDVLAVADSIKPGIAEQFLAILSSAFNDFYEREWVAGNPARNRLRVTGGRRVRHRTPTEKEFLALWKAFEAEGDPAFGAFALLAFTGCRRREVTQVPHHELDLDAAKWTLPASRRKTGKKDPEPFEIHLHRYVIDVLRRQPVLEGSPFVFWGRRDRKPFDFQNALVARVRDRSKVEDLRLHDIRRFVRSGMGRLGISQAVAEMCLGHIAKSGLVKVYDSHTYVDEKKEAWQRWGDHLLTVIEK